MTRHRVIEEVCKAVRGYVHELIKMPMDEVLKARSAFIQRLLPPS